MCVDTSDLLTFHHLRSVFIQETATGQLAKWMLDLRINNGGTVTISAL